MIGSLLLIINSVSLGAKILVKHLQVFSILIKMPQWMV